VGKLLLVDDDFIGLLALVRLELGKIAAQTGVFGVGGERQ
jgi:hypothetical protein